MRDSFDNIEIIDSALHYENSKLSLYTHDNNSTVSAIQNHSSFSDTYSVNAITLKSFIEKNRVDRINLLKIDIESAEYDLINSFDSDDFNLIDNILVEYHLLGSKTIDDVRGLEDTLKSNGYSISTRNMNSVGGFIFAKKG